MVSLRTHVHQKFLHTLIILIVLVPTFLGLTIPKKAQAQWVVHDFIHTIGTYLGVVANTSTSVSSAVGAGAGVVSAGTGIAGQLKSYVLDTLANTVAKVVLRRITADTVNWINTGFKGNPAFVTDPNKFFLNVGDKIAADYVLSSKSPLNRLCLPFRPQIRLALVKHYLNDDLATGQCTISGIIANYNAFTKDFSQGGWAGWISVTQTDANNPYGAYNDVAQDMSIQIGNGKTKTAQDLNRGNGFLSYKKCPEGQTIGEVMQTWGNRPEPIYNEMGEVDNQDQIDLYDISPAADANKYLDNGYLSTDCNIDEETVTPGSVIAGKLNKAINSPETQLELANSINQIVNALVVQMVSQVFSSINGGLRGLSKTNASNPKSLLKKIQESTTETSVNAEVGAITGNLSPSMQAAYTGTTPPAVNLVPSEEEIRAKIERERAELEANIPPNSNTPPDASSGSCGGRTCTTDQTCRSAVTNGVTISQCVDINASSN
jgi:hypothetical protein